MGAGAVALAVATPLAAEAADRARGASQNDRAAAVDELVSALRSAVGDAALVETDPNVLQTYGHDAWSYHSGPPPDAVVFPSSTEQVASAVKTCAARGVPIIPRGSGTSLEGHTTTPYRGVVIDLSHMTSLHVRPDDMDCTVGAGVVWQRLNESLSPHGLFFPMDPGPGASIGGMVGTGCSGTNAVRYGTMKAHVLSLTVVLPDGSVIKTGRRAKKTSAPFDLTSLFVGSEGTLGIVTEATLRLSPVPESTAVAVASFPSIRAASDAVARIVRAGVQVGAVELLDEPMIRAVNAQSGFDYAPAPHLFFKFTGTHGKVEDDAARVQSIVADKGGSRFVWAADPKERERLWEARKVALWSAAAMDTTRKIATTDVCVPVSRLPDLMAAAESFAASSPLRVYAVAHAGDGNAHHFIAFDPASPSEVAEAQRLNSRLVHAAIAMDGTCTGEHGVGVGKLAYLEEEVGEGAVGLMRTIKAALDPNGIMNPGKKVPQLGSKKTEKKTAGGGVAAAASGGAALRTVGAAAGGAEGGDDEDVAVDGRGEATGNLRLLGLHLGCDCEAGHKRVLDW